MNKRIGIVVGSTRQGRMSINIATWLKQECELISTDEFVLLDLLNYSLPFFGEEDKHNVIEKWESAVGECDAFIFVTPEYNHSITGALKNALDFGYQQWDNKAAGIVSYGYGANGARAAEHLRGILGALGIADVKTHLLISLFDDVKDNTFTPRDIHRKNIELILKEIADRIK
jgi:NAD(P)H-dependent FMN reductase